MLCITRSTCDLKFIFINNLSTPHTCMFSSSQVGLAAETPDQPHRVIQLFELNRQDTFLRLGNINLRDYWRVSQALAHPQVFVAPKNNIQEVARVFRHARLHIREGVAGLDAVIEGRHDPSMTLPDATCPACYCSPTLPLAHDGNFKLFKQQKKLDDQIAPLDGGMFQPLLDTQVIARVCTVVISRALYFTFLINMRFWVASCRSLLLSTVLCPPRRRHPHVASSMWKKMYPRDGRFCSEECLHRFAPMI